MGIKYETHKKNLEESLKGMQEIGLKNEQIIRALTSYMKMHHVYGEVIIKDNNIVIIYK